MLLTFLTLIFAAVFFVWGKLRSDIVALIALVVLAVGGVITTQEALSGFGNSIVIMMIGLFVVGGAIFNTGLAKIIGAKLLQLAGNSQSKLFLLVVGGTAFIGAFVSNTGTVALMLPIVVSMCTSGGNSPSRLLMPLAFAGSLGGMLTLIGTPPNLIIAELWEEAGNAPLSFFSFLPGGLICLVAGTLLLIPLSKWFLSGKTKNTDSSLNHNKSLAQLVEEYNLQANLYRLFVPGSSRAVNKSIAELSLRKDYGLEILEVRSGESSKKLIKKVRQHAPGPNTQFRTGDYVYVRGSNDDVRRFAHDYGLSLADSDTSSKQMEFYDIGLAEIVLMPNSPILNKTLGDIGFRKRFGVNVVAIRRKKKYISANLPNEQFKAGDVLLVQGTWEAIDGLSAETQAWVVLGQPLAEASKVTLDYKAPLAAAIMLGMVAMLVLDVFPAVVVVMIAALLCVLLGCFRNVEDAYRKINWESTVLIAAMMPMSFALEKTGISELVSGTLVGSLGSFGPTALLAGLYFTTSLLTMFISNTATAVLVAPIAVQSALALGVSPLPFLFAVTYGASLCFASPFSTPPNALVMPAGQYTFADYIKVGLPPQVLLGILMIFVLPLLFPF